MNLLLNLPINSVSFGQVSAALLRSIIADSQNGLPNMFPIGQIDTGSFPDSKMLNHYIEKMVMNAHKSHSRKVPALKLWHINGSLESYSNEQSLITFHETDTLTDVEVNALSNQKNVFVTSSFTKEVFESHGLENVKYLELGFDPAAFRPTNKQYYLDGSITFGLYGKFEHRKRTAKILSLWAKNFGNNPKYRLHCSIYNPFLVRNNQDLNNNFIAEALGGKMYNNIVFFNSVRSNEEYNDIINSADIVLAFSGGEGLDMPVFHSVGLGKHCAGLRAHSYKDYLNNRNAVLVEASAKIPCYDNIFFQQGAPYNQGFFFDFSEDDFVKACMGALNRHSLNKINAYGQELQQRTYANTWTTLKQSIL